MTTHDLVQRFKFLGLGNEERNSLRALRPLVQRTLPGILDQFYADIAEFPDVSHMFKDSQTRKHAREKQLAHWLLICEAKFDSNYLDSVNRIGETHARLGLKPEWYFGGYAKIMSGLISELVNAQSKSFILFRLKDTSEDLQYNLATLTKTVMLDVDLCISTIESCRETQKQSERLELAENFQGTLSTVISSIGSISEQLTANAQDMSKTAQSASNKSADLTNSAQDASTSADTVSQSAQELTSAIAEIAQSAAEAANQSSTAENEAERTSAIMTELAQSAEKIGEIVSLIESVAEQTNLLALNATIEAARAGEAGKGFAVVASEVKGLASQTAKATEEISSQVLQIQTVVSNAVGAINEVAQSINQVSSASTSISAAVEEQNAATAEISRNIELTATSTDILAKTMGEVLEGTQEASELSVGVQDAVRDLRQQIDKLNTDSSAFLNEIRSA